MQSEIRNELSSRELRELQESLTFTLLWKAALFLLVFSFETAILLNVIPSGMTNAMKMFTYFLLAFTTLQLLLFLMVESRTIRRHSGILFGIGVAATVLGLLTGIFRIG